MKLGAQVTGYSREKQNFSSLLGSLWRWLNLQLGSYALYLINLVQTARVKGAAALAHQGRKGPAQSAGSAGPVK